MSRLPARERPVKDPLSPTTQAILQLIQGLLPALSAVVVGGWVAFTFLQQQKEAQASLLRQSEKENLTRLTEARKPFIEKQFSIYFEIVEVAGKFVHLKPQSKEWMALVKQYDDLTFGAGWLVSDKETEIAMSTFGGAVKSYKPQEGSYFSFLEIVGPYSKLVTSLRSAIRRSWIEPDKLLTDARPPASESAPP
jgi:hypothetical protein